MARILDVYRRLRSVTDVTVDQAMAAALPTADPQAVRLIALTLLARQHAEGHAALVYHFDQFPVDIQSAIVNSASRWDASLRRASAQKSHRAPANVVRIVAAAKAAHLAYLITEQLRHRPPPLRIQAAGALLELARWAGTAEGERPNAPSDCNAASARHVQLAVEEAVRIYHAHKRPEVLLALAALAPRMLRLIMTHRLDSDDSVVTDMKRLFSVATRPEVRRAMLAMIQVPTLSQAIEEGLSVTRDGRHFPDVLTAWHLLLYRRVADPLRRLARPQRFWPDLTDLNRWPADATRGLSQWAATLGFSQRQRVEHLDRLIHLPDAMSRLAVLRQLIYISEDPDQGSYANRVIARFCQDPEIKLAFVALRHLISCQWSGLRTLLLRLVNSPHGDLARMAGRQLAPIGFERLWHRWPKIPSDQRLALGRALIKIGADWRSQVAAKLVSDSRADRRRAISMIQELGQGQAFETALLAMIQYRDPMIVSAAARALGTTRSPRTERALGALLQHADGRVRANTIAALQQRQCMRYIDQISSMARKEQSRPRANAIRFLLHVHDPNAIHALDRMLGDPDPDQRASALWVVDTTGLVDVVGRVAEMSVTDTDRHVSKRAGRVIHQLISFMSTGMTPHPATPVPA